MGFFIIKGGFNKQFLFTDNPLLAVATTLLIVYIDSVFRIHGLVQFFIVMPAFTFILFFILFLYRFFRNPNRKIVYNKNHVLSPADGRIIYIKELDDRTFPVSVKKRNMIRLDEITKTDMLKTPCYLIGIAMTLFDVHYNRTPVDGKVKLIQHTDGVALGLRNPDSTFINERNTFVIEDDDKNLFGVIQIAARGVRRCIATVNEKDQVKQGGIIGKIRFGSQVDLIVPRSYIVQVREGDQVYAGTSLIAKK
jgi:phosphatidylserine decarboxylase